MAHILATHDPFLQSKAQLFVLPVSTDGNILHPVVARCKTMFAENYQVYYQSAVMGELTLGQVMLNRVSRQQTGLGVRTDNAEYVANLLVQKFAYHQVSERMFLLCLKTLKPMVYELMRYQGLRRVAFIASPLLVQHTDVPTALTAGQIIELWTQVFGDVPKLSIFIHFAKDVILPKKVLENQSESE